MLIYANLCKYHRQTGGRTDKHIKSMVRNLTISLKRLFLLIKHLIYLEIPLKNNHFFFIHYI